MKIEKKIEKLLINTKKEKTELEILLRKRNERDRNNTEKLYKEYAQKHDLIYKGTSFGTGDKEPTPLYIGYKTFQQDLKEEIERKKETIAYVKNNAIKSIKKLQNEEIEIKAKLKEFEKEFEIKIKQEEDSITTEKKEKIDPNSSVSSTASISSFNQ